MYELDILCGITFEIPRKLSNPSTGLILGLRPTNERQRYFVTTSLIGWTQA